MKRFVTYALFMVLSAVSCREKIDVPVVDEIAFSAPEVAETKSILITDKTEMVSGAGELAYSVFASRYIPNQDGGIDMSTHVLFMDNVKVYSKDNGSTWKYGESTLYWSPGAVHTFFAVYPYYDEESESDTYDMGLSFGIDVERHALKMTGKHEIDSKKVICTGTDEDGKNICPDILYGVMSYPVPYAVGEDRDPVRFNMNHALAAVSFRLRNASDNIINSVTAGPVTGFMNASDYVLLSHEGPIWDKESFQTLAGHQFNVPSFESDITSGAYYEPAGKKYWYTALMIPQEFGAYQDSPSFAFNVVFSDGNKDFSIDFKDYPVNSVAEYAFTYLPGYHYVYNLNVTASNITCDVDIVPWIEDEPIELN